MSRSLKPFELHVSTGMVAVAAEAALLFARASRKAVGARGAFTVVLSGGSTPKLLFDLLATEPAYGSEIPWAKTHVFFADERHVAPEHAESNFGQAQRLLLSRRPIPSDNIHRIKAEAPDPGVAAAEYSTILREFFALRGFQAPPFDLALLGLGADGHTASLFPGVPTPAPPALVAAPWVPTLRTHRITLTPFALNGSQAVIFVVGGEAKAVILRSVLEGPPDRFPAQVIRPKTGRALWLADSAAARFICRPSAYPRRFPNAS